MWGMVAGAVVGMAAGVETGLKGFRPDYPERPHAFVEVTVEQAAGEAIDETLSGSPMPRLTPGSTLRLLPYPDSATRPARQGSGDAPPTPNWSSTTKRRSCPVA
jgi:hypothetical protein